MEFDEKCGMICRDFGFDLLGLGEVLENLERFKELEFIYVWWVMFVVVSSGE